MIEYVLDLPQVRSTYRAIICATILAYTATAPAYPTRGAPGRNDGLNCNGNLVLLGDSKLTVLGKCGQPQNAERGCISGSRIRVVWCWDRWTYRPDPSYFPRMVGFENNCVTSIIAESRFD